jgi:hypothetical protein
VNAAAAYGGPFVAKNVQVEVPHTASVKPCHQCQMQGRLPCGKCQVHKHTHTHTRPRLPPTRCPSSLTRCATLGCVWRRTVARLPHLHQLRHAGQRGRVLFLQRQRVQRWPLVLPLRRLGPHQVRTLSAQAHTRTHTHTLTTATWGGEGVRRCSQCQGTRRITCSTCKGQGTTACGLCDAKRYIKLYMRCNVTW